MTRLDGSKTRPHMNYFFAVAFFPAAFFSGIVRLLSSMIATHPIPIRDPSALYQGHAVRGMMAAMAPTHGAAP